jgi:hypothetical protein
MTTSDATATQFTPGKRAFIAVAAWNGSNQEVGARKQISADVAMLIEQPRTDQGIAPIVLPPPVEKSAIEKYWWIGFVGGAALLVAGAALFGHLMGRPVTRESDPGARPGSASNSAGG